MIERLDSIKRVRNGNKLLGDASNHLPECGIEDSLLELIYLRVSQINRCASCIEMQTRELLKAGTAVEKIALVMVWREAASLFTAREQAALLWTESVISAAETTIPNRDYFAVTAEFTSNELRDLTIVITLMNTYNRLGIRYRRNTPMLLEMHS